MNSSNNDVIVMWYCIRVALGDLFPSGFTGPTKLSNGDNYEVSVSGMGMGVSTLMGCMIVCVHVCVHVRTCVCACMRVECQIVLMFHLPKTIIVDFEPFQFCAGNERSLLTSSVIAEQIELPQHDPRVNV